MKKSLVAGLIALPMLTLSSLSFAAEADTTEPTLLTAVQMDAVTAGGRTMAGSAQTGGLRRALAASFKWAEITQVNASPVTIVQVGNYNTAIVYSGNFAVITQ